MDPTLSTLQQKTVWDGWLSAEIRANYFADLCTRYQWWQQATTVVTLIASSVAFIALLQLFPSWVGMVFAAAATGVSLWSVVVQNYKRAADCSTLHARWSRLANQYRSLWDGMYADDAPERLDALLEQEADISQSSNAFPNRESLMRKWQAHVQIHHATEHA